MGISKDKRSKSVQFFQNFGRFHNFLPQNVVSFLKIFEQVPLTMLLQDILQIENGKNSPLGGLGFF
jgi:hypothetical protein